MLSYNLSFLNSKLIFELLKDFHERYFNWFSSYVDTLKYKRKLQSKTGWYKIHQKVKYELIKAYSYFKKNIHYRKQSNLNRWYWRERVKYQVICI